MLIQDRVYPVILKRRGNPFRQPLFATLRRLEPGRIAFGVFGFSPNPDLPKIAGARLEVDRRAVRQAVNAETLNLAAVEDNLLEIAVETYQDLGGSLYLIASFLNDPGEGWFFDGEAQGIGNMIGLKMGYFHDLALGGGQYLSLVRQAFPPHRVKNKAQRAVARCKDSTLKNDLNPK